MGPRIGVESDQAKKVCHWMHDIIDRLYTMLITPPANLFGVTSRKDNRVYLRRRVIANIYGYSVFGAVFTYTFGGVTTQKPLASGPPPWAPLGEPTALPQTP